jgi:hypothetical protein
MTRAEQWIAQQRAIWEGRLDRLEAYVKDLEAKDKKDETTA